MKLPENEMEEAGNHKQVNFVLTPVICHGQFVTLIKESTQAVGVLPAEKRWVLGILVSLSMSCFKIAYLM